MDYRRVVPKGGPAAARNPRQAAGDLIVSALSRAWLPRSVIASAPSSDPDVCRNNLVRFQGRVEEDDTDQHNNGWNSIRPNLSSTSRFMVEPNDGSSISGWRKLAARLTQLGVTRIGIEATGGCERGVVEHLRAAKFIVLVMQPMQVKAFGRVHLRRAQNDALDAVLIAACAPAIDQPRIAPDARLADLAGYLTYFEQIEEDTLD